jgi:hypothetical protein
MSGLKKKILGNILATFSKATSDLKIFFTYFWCFYIKMNKFQGYSHWKSYFHQKSTHPTVHDRIWTYMSGFDWAWPDLTGHDRIQLYLTGFERTCPDSTGMTGCHRIRSCMTGLDRTLPDTTRAWPDSTWLDRMSPDVTGRHQIRLGVTGYDRTSPDTTVMRISMQFIAHYY